MSNFVSKLQDAITPEVLAETQGFEGSDDAKKSALDTLYSLLGLRLSDKTVADRLAGVQDDAYMGTLISGSGSNTPIDASTVNAAIATNAGLSVSTVHALTAAALPKAYRYLQQQAGATPLASYVSADHDSLLSGLPSWLVALLPAGLLTATAPVATETVAGATAAPVAAETVHTEGVLTKEEKREGSFMKALLPIIGCLILAGLAWMLLKSCQTDPTPVAAPAPVAAEQVVAAPVAAALSHATLNVALDETGNMIYACDGDLGSTDLASDLTDKIKAVFADANNANCHLETSSAVSSDFVAQEYVPKILDLMKGVPNATVSIVDKTVYLNASDAEALKKLVADVKEALPADFNVLAEPQLIEADAVAAANMEASEAITDTATLDQLVAALNKQIINFAVDSAEIPAENKAILDKAAARLKELPEVQLLITGHTDTQGTHEYNQKLSEDRAKSVHDYLVSQGVNDDKLDVQGKSFDEPIASNATEQGRFKNRRIEFQLMNAGEAIATVASADATPAVAAEAVNVDTDGSKATDGAPAADEAKK